MARKYSRPITILKHARELIADRSRWTQGEFYNEGPDGQEQYCAMGALYNVADADGQGVLQARSYLSKAARMSRGRFQTPVTINDDPMQKPHVAHRNVLAMYDRAIKLAAVEAT